MDAREVLRQVADTYKAVQTLEIDAVTVNESGDEDSNHRGEQRVRFYYAAPNRLRFEPRGKGASILQVADGTNLHTLFGRPRGFDAGPRVATRPLSEVQELPNSFRPEFPISNEACCLFHRIEEGVVECGIVGREDGCYVVAATYEPSPHPVVARCRGVRFWIDEKSMMVRRHEGEIGHRFPTEDEVTWNKAATVVRSMRLNEPLPDGVFEFRPPEGAERMPSGVGGFGGGGGSIGRGADSRRHFEHRSSHEWQGDALVERAKWKTRGIEISLERRLTFTEDGKAVNIVERITGPVGEAEGEFHLPVE